MLAIIRHLKQEFRSIIQQIEVDSAKYHENVSRIRELGGRIGLDGGGADSLMTRKMRESLGVGERTTAYFEDRLRELNAKKSQLARVMLITLNYITSGRISVVQQLPAAFPDETVVLADGRQWSRYGGVYIRGNNLVDGFIQIRATDPFPTNEVVREILDDRL